MACTVLPYLDPSNLMSSEKAMAPHSSTLASEIPWTEEPDGLQSLGLLRVSDFTFPFHFHALEKKMAAHSSVLAWRISETRGAWWAAVYGVTQSRTRLMWLSSSSSSSNLMSCCSQTWRNPLQPSDWALGSSFCLASSPPSCQCGSQTDSPQAGAYLSFQSVPFLGLPWWFMAKTPCSQCRRPGVQSLVREWDPMCCS